MVKAVDKFVADNRAPMLVFQELQEQLEAAMPTVAAEAAELRGLAARPRAALQ